MDGLLNLDKPAGMTSHDVVAAVRRLAGQRRVGHAGTLDPAATGVLVVALGAATRLIEYVQDGTLKRYLATVRLGVTTATDDAEGEVIGERPVPALTPPAIEAALAPFRGAILQVPPMYAALHHGGRRLYELAREGATVEREARPVLIERLALVSWESPLLILDVTCGKGTYIRALARDIGAALGCGAHLAALRRTEVGPFRSDEAVALDGLTRERLVAALLPPVSAVADWPARQLDAEELRRVRDGMPIVAAPGDGPRARAHAPDGTLVALLRRDGDSWRPAKVFAWDAAEARRGS